jgi:hypothetical protein
VATDDCVLRYRLGDLEGSTVTTIIVDADARTLISIDDWACCA